MMRPAPLAAIAATLGVSACATALPTGPTVMALPSQGKSFAQFQQEDYGCRNYASGQIGYANPGQVATQNAVGSAAVGTALGAAAGAVIGAAAGNPGAGAAIGAGSGLLVGSGVGLNNANAGAANLQQRYDIAYTQCMYLYGDVVQAGAPLTGPGYAGYYPGYGYYPAYGGTTVALGFGTGWGYGPGWGYRRWGYPGWGYRHW